MRPKNLCETIYRVCHHPELPCADVVYAGDWELQGPADSVSRAVETILHRFRDHSTLYPDSCSLLFRLSLHNDIEVCCTLDDGSQQTFVPKFSSLMIEPSRSHGRSNPYHLAFASPDGKVYVVADNAVSEAMSKIVRGIDPKEQLLQRSPSRKSKKFKSSKSSKSEKSTKPPKSGNPNPDQLTIPLPPDPKTSQ